MPERPISLKDLARELNVSISTVSRALKNHPDISKEVTERVQALASELRYKPNPLALGLLKQQTRAIGIIVPDIVTFFYSSIISGIESVAREFGYYIVIASSNESLQKECENIENLLALRVEGLIVCISRETNSYEHFDKVKDNKIPLVFFDRVCRQSEFSSVTVNNFEAARKAVCHFYEMGARRIVHFAGPQYLNIAKERLDGFKQGLADCGLPFNEESALFVNLEKQHTQNLIRGILEKKKLPDAILAVNDSVVFVLMKELRRLKINIPKDIALIGFADDFHATLVEPELTSIEHPTFEIGEEAAKLLFESLNPKFNVKQVVLDTKLVIRASTLK